MAKKHTKTSVNITRMLYLLVCELAGSALAFQSFGPEYMWAGVLTGLAVGAFFIMVESLMKQFTIRGFSTATFGLVIGLFCAWLLTTVKIGELFTVTFESIIKRPDDFIITFNVTMYATLGFIGTVLALRSNQDDFAFVIPYVRFRQENQKGQPLLLDTDVITDGRLTSLMSSGFLDNNLIIPRFVLEELQIMSNSPSPSRRQRGQRGLDCLEDLQNSQRVKVNIHDAATSNPDESHDALLMQISRLLDAKLLTTDDNLSKVARLQNVKVLNINDLADSLKPKVAVGAQLHLAIVRTGKEEHQGVGYLPDGTMIVVNNAVSKIGTSQDVTVISTINTSAGVMVFAEMDKVD
ncbi:PIN/TRAM domain-containing protein [Rubritalea spongiae]|uniref:PIN/TRAM domain-containing protein n=1 Tax=Rubritalea spongiae TaxID=430797 RepID=A0ABW5E234_9BACT